MTTKFYGRASEAATEILSAFQNPSELPERLATVFIHRKDDSPCRRWSWGNQLITAIRGHADARGFRQWQAVGRFVRKGEKSFTILSPIIKKFTDKETGKEKTALCGFKGTAVFGLKQTDGEPLDSGNPELDKWVESLPLLDVARQWDISVETFNGRGASCEGLYRPDGHIALGSTNLLVWCHELVHAADDRVTGGLKGGQHLNQEVVAQLGGSILLTLLGLERDADVADCWGYIQSISRSRNVEPISVCEKLLKRTCDAVALILETAESLQQDAEAIA